MPSKLGYKLGGRHSFPKLENPAEEREKNPTMTGASFHQFEQEQVSKRFQGDDGAKENYWH